MRERLRVVIADDERPARSLLAAMLTAFEDVDLVGQAEDGGQAVEMIERLHPDLAILDLQMPEVDGLGVVRLLKKKNVPVVAFVTAYDQYAVSAFELNAVDYLLKPVEVARLRECLDRTAERLDRADLRESQIRNIRSVADEIAATDATLLRRIPVRRGDRIILVPVESIASVVADGELLHIMTANKEKHTISYRLKDLEARLDPDLFVRLGRGTIVNIGMIRSADIMPGGTYRVTLMNGQELSASRIHSRILRERLLRLHPISPKRPL